MYERLVHGEGGGGGGFAVEVPAYCEVVESGFQGYLVVFPAKHVDVISKMNITEVEGKNLLLVMLSSFMD